MRYNTSKIIQTRAKQLSRLLIKAKETKPSGTIIFALPWNEQITVKVTYEYGHATGGSLHFNVDEEGDLCEIYFNMEDYPECCGIQIACGFGDVYCPTKYAKMMCMNLWILLKACPRAASSTQMVLSEEDNGDIATEMLRFFKPINSFVHVNTTGNHLHLFVIEAIKNNEQQNF